MGRGVVKGVPKSQPDLLHPGRRREAFDAQIRGRGQAHGSAREPVGQKLFSPSRETIRERHQRIVTHVPSVFYMAQYAVRKGDAEEIGPALESLRNGLVPR